MPNFWAIRLFCALQHNAGHIALQHVKASQSLRKTLMRFCFLIASLVLPVHAALAQTYYAEQNYPPPAGYSQQQVSGNYYAVPNQAPVAQPAYPTPAEQSQQLPVNQARPSDYGQSVMTDIRQMNF